MLQQIWARLLRLGFYLLYNEMAWSYDAVSWLVSLGQWRLWQRAALPYVNGRSVLELAHGPGHMLRALHDDGRDAVGLDLSPFMGRLARRRLAEAGAAVPLVRGDAMALPFAANTFDTVLATFPTEFILHPATLRAAHRVLRADGRFLIIPEGHLSGRSPLHRFIERLYEVTGQRNGAFAVDDEGQWPAWRGRFDAAFAEAGFDVKIVPVALTNGGATVVVARKMQ